MCANHLGKVLLLNLLVQKELDPRLWPPSLGFASTYMDTMVWQPPRFPVPANSGPIATPCAECKLPLQDRTVSLLRTI